MNPKGTNSSKKGTHECFQKLLSSNSIDGSAYNWTSETQLENHKWAFDRQVFFWILGNGNFEALDSFYPLISIVIVFHHVFNTPSGGLLKHDESTGRTNTIHKHLFSSMKCAINGCKCIIIIQYVTYVGLNISCMWMCMMKILTLKNLMLPGVPWAPVDWRLRWAHNLNPLVLGCRPSLAARIWQVHSPVDACLAATEEAQAEKEQTGLTLDDFVGPLLVAVSVCLLGHWEWWDGLVKMERTWEKTIEDLKGCRILYMRGAVVEHVEKTCRDLMVKLKGVVVFGSHLGLDIVTRMYFFSIGMTRHITFASWLPLWPFCFGPSSSDFGETDWAKVNRSRMIQGVLWSHERVREEIQNHNNR